MGLWEIEWGRLLHGALAPTRVDYTEFSWGSTSTCKVGPTRNRWENGPSVQEPSFLMELT